jgi:pimeloyl-ACP methyl ester carboxylesterase
MLDHGRNQISLGDGRRLVFSLAGPSDGIPVVYCHGAIGTALETSVDLESITSELGIRHIAICRPGIGGSDPAPGRDLLGFADDVRELADALSIDRFKLVGVSAGDGVGGMIDDYLVYARPWGFDPREVTTEIQLWHGARDPLVPLEHALQLAVTLPRSQLFVAADEGHHFFRRRLRRILAALVGRELHGTNGTDASLPLRRSPVAP